MTTAVSGLAYSFEQAAFLGMGAEKLFEVLQEAGYCESHAKAIGRAWAKEGKVLVSRLKERPLGPPILSKVDYHLSILMGQSSLLKLQ